MPPALPADNRMNPHFGDLYLLRLKLVTLLRNQPIHFSGYLFAFHEFVVTLWRTIVMIYSEISQYYEQNS